MQKEHDYKQFLEQNRENFSKRLQEQQQIRERRMQHYLEKRKEVEIHKNHLNDIRSQYRTNIMNRQHETQERNKLIRMKH